MPTPLEDRALQGSLWNALQAFEGPFVLAFAPNIGSQFWLPVHADCWEAVVMSQITGSLLPTEGTGKEFLALGFSPGPYWLLQTSEE